MGYMTLSSKLIGNPTVIRNFRNKHKWQFKTRMVFKDSSVSEIGKCDQEGYFYVNNNSFFSFFSKSYLYSYGNVIKDGFIITDIVYKYLKKNKNFNKCIKNNLYNLLKKYKSKNQMDKYSSQQDVMIYDSKKNDKMTNKEKIFVGYILDKDLWKFENPELNSSDSKKNKKRIMKIINDFINYSYK